MASFTTRVVLSDADRDDYETLHQYMAAKGFSKTITSDKGTAYELPDAEYDYKGDVSKSDVLELAKAAAARVGRKYKVLVTESKGRVWHGLAPA